MHILQVDRAVDAKSRCRKRARRSHAVRRRPPASQGKLSSVLRYEFSAMHGMVIGFRQRCHGQEAILSCCFHHIFLQSSVDFPSIN